MRVDYYNILKVNQNASEEDLKKAYKRLAMKKAYKREAEAKFKQISAYDMLSDPQKCQIYDVYGRRGFWFRWNPSSKPGIQAKFFIRNLESQGSGFQPSVSSFSNFSFFFF
jgi:DnaJ-class molecular chaperone